MLEQQLPRSILDTDHLAAADRYDAWRDSFSVVFGYDVDERVTPSRFRGRIDNTLFDQFMLTHFCASAASYERSASRVGRDGVDMVMLQLYLQGPCRFRTRDLEGSSDVGDIVIMDMSRPLETRHDFQENLTLCLPRKLLLDVVPNLDHLHCQVLAGGEAMTSILAAHMRALHGSVGSLTVGQADAVTRPTLELAGAAIRAGLGDGVDDSGPLRSAMRAKADSVIDRMLRSPDLSPDAVAAQVPCSRSRLFALYAEDGGVMRHVQLRRLRGACRDLGAPQCRHKTIGLIASDWGFASASSFHRAFRAEFGMTPSDARTGFARQIVWQESQSQVRGATSQSRQYETWVVKELSSGRSELRVRGPLA